jgi:hypothetical protein
VVTPPIVTGRTGATAQTEGRRADLIRAETVLQIAQEALSSIDLIYSGMQDLADLAHDENLTDGERAAIAAAFQNFAQGIEDIVRATVFDGAHILAGGDGPDGAFTITLAAVIQFGLPLDILIPAIPLLDIDKGFEESGLLTAGSARSIGEGAQKAAQIVRSQGDRVALQRAGLQQIHATEPGPNLGPGDHVGTFGSLEYAEHLSQLVAKLVVSGGHVPFHMSAQQMRGVLERSRDDQYPVAAVTRSGAPGTALPEPVHSDEILQMPAPVVKAVEGEPSRVPGLAGPATSETGAPPVDGVVLDGGHQAPNSHKDQAPQQGKKPVAQGNSLALAAPSAPVGELASLSAGVVAVAHGAPSDRTVPQPIHGVYQPLRTDGPGDLMVGQIGGSHHRDGVTPLPGETSAVEIGAGRPDDLPLDRAIAATLAFAQPGNQAVADLRQAELSRLGELDASRRVAGLVHHVREADIRADAGVTIVKTTYEPPTDQLREFAASIPVEPGRFMAELLRADNMLHVADLSIEQMDLHLDYIGGLAEEAAADPSRDRIALDEIFQAVKSNIIDTLAQTTEARGEKILSGGDGPQGEFVIHLSEGGGAGKGHAIAIPSMRMEDLSPDLFFADIRTRETALAAVDHIEFASADAVQVRDMIAEQRSFIRQLISLEITQQASRPPVA